MLEWTGERVVPNKMSENDMTLKQHLARYRFALDYCKGKVVLDAACGTGYGSALLKEVARNVEGADIDSKTIEYAKEHYPGIIFHTCDLEVDFVEIRPDWYYNVVVSFETIEHLKNPHHFLRHVAKHLESFIFSIPLNNPSKFHKQVYSLEQAQNLIYKYFTTVEWIEQTETEISPFNKEAT